MKTGKCIKDTANAKYKGSSWGNLSDVELVANCLDSASQFRFRDNGAMLNLKRQGCLAAAAKFGSGLGLDMFYLYVDAVRLDRYACAQNATLKIYRAITQTSAGALSVKYKGNGKSTYQTWCAEPKTNTEYASGRGIDPYIALTTPCSDVEDQIFNFGKFC